MPPVGFEPTISAGEWPKTYSLDCAAIGTGNEDGDGDNNEQQQSRYFFFIVVVIGIHFFIQWRGGGFAVLACNWLRVMKFVNK
jgi:hypothetical protein